MIVLPGGVERKALPSGFVCACNHWFVVSSLPSASSVSSVAESNQHRGTDESDRARFQFVLHNTINYTTNQEVNPLRFTVGQDTVGSPGDGGEAPKDRRNLALPYP